MANLLEMLPKIVSGQMGLDEILHTFNIKRTQLTGNDAAAGLDRLVSDAMLPGVEVHEAIGNIKGVPCRCIVVSRGKLI